MRRSPSSSDQRGDLQTRRELPLPWEELPAKIFVLHRMQTKSRRTHTDTKYGYRYKIHIHNRHCAVLAAICMACTLSHECLFMSSYASLRLLRGFSLLFRRVQYPNFLRRAPRGGSVGRDRPTQNRAKWQPLGRSVRYENYTFYFAPPGQSHWQS